jgi:anti-sigma regulatory factor (Ser/Thr protein kinase)
MTENRITFRIDLLLPFGRQAVRSARKAIGVVAGEWKFSEKACREIELCFSEALQNAMEHGSSGKGSVRVFCGASEQSVKIVIEDPGAGLGDIEALRSALEEKEERIPRQEIERGRGIFLIKKLMDSAKMENLEKGGVRIIMIKKKN